MGLQESGFTGRNTTESTDSQTGLLLQNAESQTQGRDGSTQTVIPTTVGAVAASDSNVEFGLPFVIHLGVSVGEAGGGDATYNERVFGTSGSPFKFRVLLWWLHMVDNDGADCTFSIYHYTLDSDGALDTASLMSNASKFTGLNDSDLFGFADGTAQVVESNCIVDSGEELACRFLTSDSTVGSEYSVKVLCMRIQ